uniref:Pre-rRNA-processing protein las1 n=1 Tax=Talaromyces marneffei PM1 TaxID=1077442 RepID=A0A093VML0_TALMA
MPKVIITPWRDESELLDVEAWKLRGHLPHAVEATALLTDAILHDDSTHNSVFSIRATYAAAFSRFVTGLVDTKLGSGGGGGTMFNRASMIGLPLSFVELRHETAHRELPSLVLLRGYTNRALEWLWDYYWVRIDQSASFSVKTGEDGLRGRVKVLLQQFWQQARSDNSRKRVRSLATSVSQSLGSICKSDVEGAKVICRVLLEDGFLVPENRHLASSIETIFSTWDSVLQPITDSSKTFLTILTEEMAKQLSNKSNTPATTEDPYLEGVYLWLEHILTSETWIQYKRFLCSTPYLRFACEEWSNHWTNMLAKIIAQEAESSQVYDSLPIQSVPSIDEVAPTVGAAPLKASSTTPTLHEPSSTLSPSPTAQLARQRPHLPPLNAEPISDGVRDRIDYGSSQSGTKQR